MLNNVEPLLLNVLFLVTSLIFVPLLVERSEKFTKAQKLWFKIVVAGIAIVVCMSFPLRLQEGFTFDLRNVAVLIASFYGGVPAAIFSWFVINIYRFYLGGFGFYSNLLISTVVLIYCLIAFRKFQQQVKRGRLLFSLLSSIGVGFFVIAVLTIGFSVEISFYIGLTYLLLLVSTTVGSTYVIEILRADANLRRRIVKAEKMEVVSHLASSISHEVRNPLAVVKGFLQLLNSADLPKHKQQEFIQLSISEINRANDIIKNYLTFAKPALENVQFVDIKKELQSAVDMITPLANMNCVEIQTKIDTYIVKSDPQLIQQCILNITKNCIEAMPDCGKLIIETKHEGKELIIEVSDTGMGMSEEQLARIGEPYFTTKGREGTGLGMMIVFQIVEMINGKITITSKLGVGTSFTIRLPVVDSST